jgi:outer membrane protein assembly factor BamB
MEKNTICNQLHNINCVPIQSNDVCCKNVPKSTAIEWTQGKKQSYRQRIKRKKNPTFFVALETSNQLCYLEVFTGKLTNAITLDRAIDDIAKDSNGSIFAIEGGNIYTINTTDGTTTLIGPTGESYLNTLTFGDNDTLYSAHNDLFTINTSTGQATIVGTIGYQVFGDLVYFNGYLYTVSVDNKFIKINTETGTGTEIATLGTQIFGLATDDGKIFGIKDDNVFFIDVSTGGITQISTITPYSNAPIGMA